MKNEQTTDETASDPGHRVRRLADDSLRFVKARAGRNDRVGEATYRALELVSGGLDVAAKALDRLGEATQPPVRGTIARASRRTRGKTG
jgi:hypothetical protein